ncbi:MAG: gamma-glutamyl-gamma-aminobutyrate hydrolase family protein [Oscillospiraceae bacterium]|jgi:putative glutamine amidotransferase|nr:gamma-glutamyl-gamma-aminobutyrate hydrolase family protein [Oscillospiraceae bacterium]
MNILIAGESGKFKNYSDAVARVGAVPTVSLTEADFSRFDGLILPGGDDIDPAFFGQENNGSEGIDTELDRTQFAIMDAFVKAGKPIFGICRGHQVINVYFGGSLMQDLPTAAQTHRWNETDGDRVHTTTALPNTFLTALYGDTEFPVNSAHHQGLGTLGAGLKAIQHAPDGVIECIVHDTLPIAGVQWHPERMCFARSRPDTVDGSVIIKWAVTR